jgi:FkbM family methyltransferase
MKAGKSYNVPLWQRLLSRAVAAYPFARGRTRLRRMTDSWLVAGVGSGVWLRTSGVVHGEWDFLDGKTKEEATLQCLRDHLRAGMTFVDVGANIGYFALQAAALVGPAGKVIAFEPTPTVADRLRENVRLNRLSNVTVVQAAVSEKAGRATFFQSAEDPEANSLYDCESCGAPLEVVVLNLDEELARQNVSAVDLMKIDAEGSELTVLKGARRVMTTLRPAVVLEVNPLTLEAGGVRPDQIFDQLAEYGYQWNEIERADWHGCTVRNIFAKA